MNQEKPEHDTREKQNQEEQTGQVNRQLQPARSSSLCRMLNISMQEIEGLDIFSQDKSDLPQHTCRTNLKRP